MPPRQPYLLVVPAHVAHPCWLGWCGVLRVVVIPRLVVVVLIWLFGLMEGMALRAGLILVWARAAHVRASQTRRAGAWGQRSSAVFSPAVFVRWAGFFLVTTSFQSTTLRQHEIWHRRKRKASRYVLEEPGVLAYQVTLALASANSIRLAPLSRRHPQPHEVAARPTCRTASTRSSRYLRRRSTRTWPSSPRGSGTRLGSMTASRILSRRCTRSKSSSPQPRPAASTRSIRSVTGSRTCPGLSGTRSLLLGPAARQRPLPPTRAPLRSTLATRTWLPRVLPPATGSFGVRLSHHVNQTCKRRPPLLQTRLASRYGITFADHHGHRTPMLPPQGLLPMIAYGRLVTITMTRIRMALGSLLVEEQDFVVAIQGSYSMWFKNMFWVKE